MVYFTLHIRHISWNSSLKSADHLKSLKRSMYNCSIKFLNGLQNALAALWTWWHTSPSISRRYGAFSLRIRVSNPVFDPLITLHESMKIDIIIIQSYTVNFNAGEWSKVTNFNLPHHRTIKANKNCQHSMKFLNENFVHFIISVT